MCSCLCVCMCDTAVMPEAIKEYIYFTTFCSTSHLRNTPLALLHCVTDEHATLSQWLTDAQIAHVEHLYSLPVPGKTLKFQNQNSGAKRRIDYEVTLTRRGGKLVERVEATIWIFLSNQVDRPGSLTMGWQGEENRDSEGRGWIYGGIWRETGCCWRSGSDQNGSSGWGENCGEMKMWPSCSLKKKRQRNGWREKKSKCSERTKRNMEEVERRTKGTDTHPFQWSLHRQAQSSLCDPILGKGAARSWSSLRWIPMGLLLWAQTHTVSHTHRHTVEIEPQTHRVKSGLVLQRLLSDYSKGVHCGKQHNTTEEALQHKCICIPFLLLFHPFLVLHEKASVSAGAWGNSPPTFKHWSRYTYLQSVFSWSRGVWIRSTASAMNELSAISLCLPHSGVCCRDKRM